MRKIFLLLLLVLIVHLGSTSPTHKRILEQDDGVELEATIEEIAQIEIDSDAVPAIPKLNSQQKWSLIRESGQDPTTRRRKSKIGRGRRDLILAPWRIRHVAPKLTTLPPKPKKAFALPVDVCPKKFDAITKGYNGRTYVFARDRVYQIWFEDGLPQKASFLINEFFAGGPRTVSAALTNSRSGVTILFDGRQAYRFRWNRKHKRFQLAKNTPQELPRNVTVTPQSAFEWADGNQVVMQGEHFIIYDAYWNLATFTGHTRRYFPNLPRDLLGIVYNGSGNTILMYTKTNKLKVYDTKKFKVVQEYPLKLNEFVGCLSS
ncbi:unnamed protein product [Caenorhabditis angaria]|uniref:Uncharacterized protein n=1 Tax=Caenorhabditis angaria TaxID=860376 RepID=A0A9P1IV97_9PELO|nr:unnamed protein product [Caenorhabditis angaria]